jgi:hypothetical protein
MTLIAHCGTTKISREDLALIPAPLATETHKPIPHIGIVEALTESLAFRHLQVVRDEYAVSPDGMRMFGVMDLATEDEQFRFAIGLRNSNDKSMRLGLTAGMRVFVCDNMAFRGDFTPVLAKHSKSLELQDVITLGVDRIQRGFEPLRQMVHSWQHLRISDDEAKVVIYDAFFTASLAPKHLLPFVHRGYFNPTYREFAPRTLWSLNNAFTSAFKDLNPVRQFQATAKLGSYFQQWA